jgi:predicted MFS family arabinose efflux permease
MLLFPTIGGICADRWKRKPVLVASDCLRGLILLALLAVHGASTVWIVYVVGFLGAAVGNFAGPFGSASVPHIVEPDHLPSANAAFSVGTNVAVLIGYPLGGLTLPHAGLRGVVILDAVTFLLSGLLIAGVDVPLEGGGEPVSSDGRPLLRRAWRDWLLGMVFIRGERWISLLFLVLLLTFLGNAILLTVLAPFVKGMLGGSAQLYAWILTAQGAGGIAAAGGIGWVTGRLSPARAIALGLLALGGLAISIAVVASIPATIIAMFLAGPPALFAVASLNTMLQSGVPDTYRGRVFGAYLTVSALASLIGSLLAGTLTDALGSRFVLAAGGGLFVVAGALALVVLAPTVRLSPTRAARN